MQPAPRDPATTEVFISYRTAETSSDAQALFRLLEERGLNVFLDAGRLRAGDLWSDEINAALASPSLAVGIVLMAPGWFDNFMASPHWSLRTGEAEKPEIVVWQEVRRLRERCDRGGCTVMPVVIRQVETGDTLPPLPPSPLAGFGELAELHQWIGRRHSYWVPLKVLHRFDHVVDAIYGAVRDSVLQRPLRRTSGITAEKTAPLPLHVLFDEAPTRQALLHYAEMIGAYTHDHKLVTLLGQEALLRHDFPAALDHLENARSIGGRTPDDPGERFRSHLWHAHTLNLFVVASLRGGRPRRRQITEASELLRKVLLRAVAIEATALGLWPKERGEQADADRASAAYVTELTVLLLWLLWQDFFRARNVRVPDATEPELRGLRERLGEIGELLRQFALVTMAPSPAAAECRFLVEDNFLDGLPAELCSPAAWDSGQMLAGVDTFVRELVA